MRQQLKMVNKQPIEPASDDTETLDVIKVFDTIQGEGPLIGCPAVFIRLAGCNLQCPLCDTNYTKGRFSIPVVDLVNAITKRWRTPQLIVVTGGEPFRQKSLATLCNALIRQEYQVQIETNGTMFNLDMPYDNKFLMVVCCPKTPKIHQLLIPNVHYFKYVIQAGHVSEKDGLPTVSLGYEPHIPYRPPQWAFHNRLIIVTPLDEGKPAANALNAEEAVRSALKYGYRITPQIHKQLGLE